MQVCEALGADPVDLPALAAALRYIGIGLTKEVETIRQEACHSLPISLKAAPIKPFYDSSLQRLSDLSAAVHQRAPPRLTTYDRDQPQVCLPRSKLFHCDCAIVCCARFQNVYLTTLNENAGCACDCLSI